MVSGPQLSFATRAWALSSVNVILHLKREPFFLLMLGVSDGEKVRQSGVAEKNEMSIE